MEWRSLGGSGVRLPTAGLSASGAFNVVGKEAQVARSALVRTTIERATPLFHVSGEAGEGQRILGAATIGDRNRSIIATSIGNPDLSEGQRQLERALHYFDGRIDLVAVTGTAHLNRYLSALQRLRVDGAVRAIGVAMYTDAERDTFTPLLPTIDIDYLEIPYNPLCRQGFEKLIPTVRDLGLGVLATHPFAGGRLARVHPPSRSLSRFSTFEVEGWPEILMKWVLSEPSITSLVAGSRRPAHIASNSSVASPWFSHAERSEVVSIVKGMIRSAS